MNAQFQFNIEYKTLEEYNDLKNHFEESKISECSICYCDIIHSNFVLTNCNHIYCIHCIKQCMQLSRYTIQTILCPYCRQIITKMRIPTEDNEINQFQCVSFKRKMNPSFMEPEPIMRVQQHNIGMYELEEQYQYQMNHILTTFVIILLCGFIHLILILWSIILIITSMTVLYYFIYIITSL
jgi:hypothetical protein